MDKEIISTNEEDKPLIFISDKAINLYKDNKKLQERIDKAIEYIENDVEVYYVLDERLQKAFNKTKKVKKDLLDILKGEDKE